LEHPPHVKHVPARLTRAFYHYHPGEIIKVLDSQREGIRTAVGVYLSTKKGEGEVGSSKSGVFGGEEGRMVGTLMFACISRNRMPRMEYLD
jgi:hypothetical protein